MWLGWLLLASAMVIRCFRGLEFPLINVLFVFIGLGAYFLPVRQHRGEKGEALRRKLLWLLLGAEFLVSLGELVRMVLARTNA